MMKGESMFIIPQPKELTFPGSAIRAERLQIKGENPNAVRYAEILGIKTAADGTQLLLESDASLQEEQYRLEICTEGMTIYYGTEEGAFRALTTLKQILEQAQEGQVPCLKIADEPSIRNRGLMLDISRGRLPKMEDLKKTVDRMSLLKYNQLQLYVEDFVYAFQNYKEYTSDKDPLTEDEIRELSAYCKERFMTLVPNINGFGHMSAWTSKEELAHLAILDEEGNVSGTLNPLDERTVPFLDRIYEGYIDVFDADTVNICMDEPYHLGMGQTKEACEAYGVGRVYTDYLKKVCDLVTKKYGKTPMFWDDIVFQHEEELVNIPKNAIVMEWGYETEQNFDRNCRKLKECGLRYYVCPGTSMWGSLTGRTDNMIRNILNAAKCGSYYGAEGFLLTEWGDGGHPQFLSLAWRPITYGAAVSWNCGSHIVEVAHEQRMETLKQCDAYLDRFVYHSTKESVARIVHRMGNYYLLENDLKFNGTHLNQALRSPDKVQDSFRKCCPDIVAYMERIQKELDEVRADELVLREVRLSCRLVLAVAYAFAEKADRKHKEEVEQIRTEFEKLWKIRNREPGMEIFTGVLKRFEAFIEKQL